MCQHPDSRSVFMFLLFQEGADRQTVLKYVFVLFCFYKSVTRDPGEVEIDPRLSGMERIEA